jgi:glutamate-1-semialdehyde 2,1-aminomutase
MLQYYLRKHGIALSWVGPGRLIFNLGFSNTDFEQFSQRFVNAAKELQEQGWWWVSTEQSNKNIKRSVALELIKARLK